MNRNPAAPGRRRCTVEPPPPPTLDDPAARRRLLALACAHGLDPDPAAVAVERATAAAAEPWTSTEAAARRVLLDALRRDPAARRPALGGPERLAGAIAGAVGDWDEVPAAERAVVAGALFDGLDLVGLARALGTHRLDVKARARRVLSRLAGEAATGSGLAAVRHMMAGEYALGLVPPDAFAPFQRGLALDPGLQALVAGWDARFAPFWQSVHVGAVPEPVHAGPPPAPVRTAPPPAVAVAHPAGGARRRLAAALAAVAVLGVGTAAWFGRSDAPRSAIVRPETLPTPTRAVAVTGEAFTPVAAAAAAATAGRAAPAAAAPPALPATASAGTAGAAVIPATRASAGAAREVTATVTVHLYHRADDPAVVDRAADLAAALRELGATVEVLDAGDLVVSADRLRFFLPEDAPAARLLVEEVAGVELQDFTHYVPQPRPGILELWMASGEAPA